MLRKLLKYDFRAIFKIWLLLSATALMLGASAGACIRGFEIIINDPTKIAFIPFCTLGIIFSFIGITAYTVAISIIIVVRYFKNFFTDEGYLTFTLPVRRNTLFNSKLITAFVFGTGSIAVTICSFVIMLAIAPGGETASTALGEVINGVRISIISMGAVMTDSLAAWITAYVVALILMILASSIFSTLLLYSCVTVGSIMVKKLKLLMAIGLYYGITLAIEMLSYLGSMLMTTAIEALASVPNIIEGVDALWVILIGMLIVTLVILTLSVFMYKFTTSKLRGNLNLA